MVGLIIVRITPFAASSALAGFALLNSPVPAHALLYRYDFISEPPPPQGPNLTWEGSASNGDVFTGVVSGFFVWDTATNTVVSNQIFYQVVLDGTTTIQADPNAKITLADLADAGQYRSLRIGTQGATNGVIPGCNQDTVCNFLQLRFDDDLNNPVVENGFNPGYKDALLTSAGGAFPTFYCQSPSNSPPLQGNGGCATSGQVPITTINGGLNGTLVPSPLSLLAIMPLGLATKARKRYSFLKASN